MHAKFVYGALDLADLSMEKVSIFALRPSKKEWESLSVVATSKHGYCVTFILELTIFSKLEYELPSNQRLEPGMTEIKVVMSMHAIL